MSVKFFRSDGTICMFDPDTFKIHLYQHGGWVESDDPKLREDIRFRSVELSREEALQLSLPPPCAARLRPPFCPGTRTGA
jgi:hypothetical protein